MYFSTNDIKDNLPALFIMTKPFRIPVLPWFMKWFFIISQVCLENDCSSTFEASAEINDFSFKSHITPDNVSIFCPSVIFSVAMCGFSCGWSIAFL